MAASFVACSQITLPGVRLTMRPQILKISGNILKLLLKQQKTNPCSGSPRSVRVNNLPENRRLASLD
jgi:hypothetical protein